MRFIGAGEAFVLCMFLINVVRPFFHSTSDSCYKLKLDMLFWSDIINYKFLRPYAYICNRFITDIRWYVSLIIAINRLINTIPVRRRYVAMINLTHDSTHESTFFVICKSSGRVNPKRAKNNISNALIGLASSVINEITIKQ